MRLVERGADLLEQAIEGGARERLEVRIVAQRPGEAGKALPAARELARDADRDDAVVEHFGPDREARTRRQGDHDRGRRVGYRAR